MSRELLNQLRVEQDYGNAVLVGDRRILGLKNKHDKLLVAAWHHACPQPNSVSSIFGVDWTIKRYSSCDFVTRSIIWKRVKDMKSKLYQELISPTPRLPGEPVGKYEEGCVPKSHEHQMSPLSTPIGYGLPRVYWEIAGRGKGLTLERNTTASHCLDIAILRAQTPIELLVKFSELSTQTEANPTAVLSHVLEPGLVEEENCRTIYKEIASEMQKSAPQLWDSYQALSVEDRKEKGILEVSSL